MASESTDIAGWLAPALVALLALLCLWLGVRVLLGVADHVFGDPQRVDAASVPAVAWNQAPDDSLARWHLFGSVWVAPDARSPLDAPESNLDLVLVGVLAESDPSAGIAMIAAADGTQSAYRVDATLPGGARLSEVHSDYVVVLNGGREERLRLPRERIGDLPPQGQARTEALHSGPAGGDGAALPTGTVAVAGLETVDWGAVQQQLRIDPLELARQVRVLPVIESGQMVGVRLSGGRNVPLLAQLGLNPDDVILAVNGVSVLDTGRAHEVIAGIASAQRATVKVRRNGREETLNVSLP